MMMLPQREVDFARLVGATNRPFPSANVSVSDPACLSRATLEHGKKYEESKY